MSELEQAFNFKELGEESLDFDAIFGGGNIPAPPPPAPDLRFSSGTGEALLQD